MSEEEARQLLADAGHEDDFFGWALYKPLHPDFPNPLYAFNWAEKGVSIDTVTQEITVAEAPGGGEPPLTTPPTDDSVSVRLISMATAEIQAVNPDAFVIWTGGRDGDGEPLAAPGDTNFWGLRSRGPGRGTMCRPGCCSTTAPSP